VRLTTRDSRFCRAPGRRTLDPADNEWRWTRECISRSEHRRRTTSKTALHNPPRAGPPRRGRSGGWDDSTRRDEERVFMADRAIDWLSVEKERGILQRGDLVAWHGRTLVADSARDWKIVDRLPPRAEKRSRFLSFFFLFFLHSLLTASRDADYQGEGNASRWNRSKVINHSPLRIHWPVDAAAPACCDSPTQFFFSISSRSRSALDRRKCMRIARRRWDVLFVASTAIKRKAARNPQIAA